MRAAVLHVTSIQAARVSRQAGLAHAPILVRRPCTQLNKVRVGGQRSLRTSSIMLSVHHRAFFWRLIRTSARATCHLSCFSLWSAF